MLEIEEGIHVLDSIWDILGNTKIQTYLENLKLLRIKQMLNKKEPEMRVSVGSMIAIVTLKFRV